MPVVLQELTLASLMWLTLMMTMMMFSSSVMSNSLRPYGLQRTRLLHPWDFPGKSAGVGCHCLLPSRKMVLKNLFTGNNGETDIENRPMDMGRGEEMVRVKHFSVFQGNWWNRSLDS